MVEEVDIGAARIFPVGQVSRVNVGQTTCALVRNGKNKVSVFVDNCPHLHMPIADGRVEEGFLICPWHGAYFHAETGASQSPLATEPLEKIPARIVEGRVLCQTSS